MGPNRPVAKFDALIDPVPNGGFTRLCYPGGEEKWNVSHAPSGNDALVVHLRSLGGVRADINSFRGYFKCAPKVF